MQKYFCIINLNNIMKDEKNEIDEKDKEMIDALSDVIITIIEKDKNLE